MEDLIGQYLAVRYASRAAYDCLARFGVTDIANGLALVLGEQDGWPVLLPGGCLARVEKMPAEQLDALLDCLRSAGAEITVSTDRGPLRGPGTQSDAGL